MLVVTPIYYTRGGSYVLKSDSFLLLGVVAGVLVAPEPRNLHGLLTCVLN